MVKNLSIFQLHSLFCSGRNFKHECRFFYTFDYPNLPSLYIYIEITLFGKLKR